MNKVYCWLIPVLMSVVYGCYKPPIIMEANPKNPDTPKNWQRIKYSDISDNSISYLRKYSADFIYDQNEILYMITDDGYLLIVEDTSNIQIRYLSGAQGSNPKLLINSKNELYIYHSTKFSKVVGDNLVKQDLLKIYETWDGEIYEWKFYEYKSVVFDSDDLAWLIDENYILYRQIPGTSRCLEISDSLISLNGWTSPKHLFFIDNEVWILNGDNEMFRHLKASDSFEFIAETGFNQNGKINIAKHNDVLYFVTYNKIFTFINNQFQQLNLYEYNREGNVIDDFNLNTIDFDYDGNMLITEYNYPIFHSDGVGSVVDPYYGSDYLFFLHTKNNQHIIVGTDALYLINDL